MHKGKSMSEALIFASTNPQYDDRLFIELQVQYMEIQRSNLRRTCCVQKLFLTFRTIFVHNMSSPCSAKRRAPDKDLPVLSSPIFSRKKAIIIIGQILAIPLISSNFQLNPISGKKKQVNLLRHRFL